MYDDEMVRKIMDRHRLLMKEFREQEFSRKLEMVMNMRSKGYENKILKEEDMVYYQIEGRKAWLGLVKIFAVKGNSIFVFTNGSIRKIPWSNVKLHRKEEEENNNFEDPKKEESEVRVNIPGNVRDNKKDHPLKWVSSPQGR